MELLLRGRKWLAQGNIVTGESSFGSNAGSFPLCCSHTGRNSSSRTPDSLVRFPYTELWQTLIFKVWEVIYGPCSPRPLLLLSNDNVIKVSSQSLFYELQITLWEKRGGRILILKVLRLYRVLWFYDFFFLPMCVETLRTTEIKWFGCDFSYFLKFILLLYCIPQSSLPPSS